MLQTINVVVNKQFAQQKFACERLRICALRSAQEACRHHVPLLLSDGALWEEGEDTEPAVEAEATWALSLACATACRMRSTTSASYSLFSCGVVAFAMRPWSMGIRYYVFSRCSRERSVSTRTYSSSSCLPYASPTMGRTLPFRRRSL